MLQCFIKNVSPDDNTVLVLTHTGFSKSKGFYCIMQQRKTKLRYVTCTTSMHTVYPSEELKNGQLVIWLRAWGGNRNMNYGIHNFTAQ